MLKSSKQQAAVTTTTIKAPENAVKKEQQPTIIKTPINIQNQNKAIMSNQTVSAKKFCPKKKYVHNFFLFTLRSSQRFFHKKSHFIFQSQTNAPTPKKNHQTFVTECERHVGTNFTACFEHKSNGSHACSATKSNKHSACKQLNWWHLSCRIRIDVGPIAIDCHINGGRRWYHIIIINQSNFSQQGNNC